MPLHPSEGEIRTSRRIGSIVLLAVTIASVPLMVRQADAQQIRASAASNRLAFSVAVPHTQAAARSCKRSGARIVGQLALGVIGAWIGGIVPFAAIDDVNAPDRRVKGDEAYQPNANTAFAIGSWVGSTLGTFLAGPQGCGSFGRTALGTGIPSVVLLLGRDDPYLPLIGVVLIAPLQAIGGTLMYPKR